MRVLIIKLSSIGDVVQTLPALRLLREGLERRGRGGERAEIDWLVEGPSSTILRSNPLIDNVVVARRRGWTRHGRESMRTARWLASRRYDLVIDFQGLLKSALWAIAARGRRVLGFANARELSHLALTEKAPPYDPERHAVLRYMDLARIALGEDAPGPAPGTMDVDYPLYLGEEAMDRAREALLRAGASAGEAQGRTGESERPFFVLAPFSRWKKKLWDYEKFSALGRAIVERHGLSAAVVGGPSQRETAERICRGMGGGGFNLAGALDLQGLAALMRLARFSVTLDSGPMHISVAAGTPVVALFGPTAPWRTGPFGRGHVVVRRDLPCSPCFRKRCADPVCMSGITVQEVLRAVEGLRPGGMRDGSTRPGAAAARRGR